MHHITAIPIVSAHCVLPDKAGYHPLRCKPSVPFVWKRNGEKKLLCEESCVKARLHVWLWLCRESVEGSIYTSRAAYLEASRHNCLSKQKEEQVNTSQIAHQHKPRIMQHSCLMALLVSICASQTAAKHTPSVGGILHCCFTVCELLRNV